MCKTIPYHVLDGSSDAIDSVIGDDKYGWVPVLVQVYWRLTAVFITNWCQIHHFLDTSWISAQLQFDVGVCVFTRFESEAATLIKPIIYSRNK